MAGPSRRELAEIRDRLRTDWPFYARTCLKIVSARGELIPLVPNAAQLKLWDALHAQRAKGQPMRAVILKARKLGFSTMVQGLVMQRITQFRNQTALVVAQDTSTATELFRIGQVMHANLSDELELKPRIVSRREGRFMSFGEPSRARQEKGILGLNSYLKTDTAQEVDAGRGYTYRLLHLSEYAFYPHPEKAVALLNAVPDAPETLVVIESTANGPNHFKDRWDQAMDGRSSYTPVFAAWWEEPSYQLPFLDEEDRAEFCETIGDGEFGEDEPRLVDLFGCTPEQLAWRRRKIVDDCESDLRIWKQEYPSSPDEAFMSTGRQVFNQIFVQRVLDRVEDTDPRDSDGPQVGVLRAGGHARRQVRTGIIDVPTNPEWVPQAATGFSRNHPFWRVWHHPEVKTEEQRAGQYVVAVDPAGGEETERGELAFHAIQVIDHRTRQQCAEWRSRIDPDLVGVEAYMAALYYNHAWLAVETTGGYGLSMARRVWRDYRYPRVYFRKRLDSQSAERQEDRIGWDTGRVSKVLLEDGMRELLREGTDGIRSRKLAYELTTYVRDERGRTGPEKNRFADLLMAYMIAQQIAQEKPILPERKPDTSTAGRSVRYASTGY